MGKRVLGKGLDALIPKKKISGGDQFVYLPIEKVDPNKFQPRKEMNQKDLAELTRSIKEKGFIQPILARDIKEGRFEVVAGGRRLEAAKLLGIKEIPAIVRDLDNKDSFIAAIVENLQRKNLNPLEEAQALQRLKDEFNFSLDEIAQFVSKDKTTVLNTMRLLKLPEKVKDALKKNLINRSQARTILSFKSKIQQEKIFYKILEKGLTVRDVEKQAFRKNKKTKADPFIEEAEEQLQKKLGTKVKIASSTNKRGKIILHYYSLNDFERIIKRIG
jgi:ParB family chromosome partitioning protein